MLCIALVCASFHSPHFLFFSFLLWTNGANRKHHRANIFQALRQPCSATDAFYLPDLKEALSCENVSLAIPDTLEGAETPVMEIPSSCSVSHHVLTPSHHPPGHEAEVNDAAPLLLRCGIVL